MEKKLTMWLRVGQRQEMYVSEMHEKRTEEGKKAKARKDLN